MMLHMIRRSIMLATLILGLSLGAGAHAQEPKDAARGEILVRRHCGGCHAVEQADASAEPAAPPLRELNRRYQPEMLAEALAEGILTGHPMMPEFRFPPEDVRAIIDYLDAIQTRQPG